MQKHSKGIPKTYWGYCFDASSLWSHENVLSIHEDVYIYQFLFQQQLTTGRLYWTDQENVSKLNHVCPTRQSSSAPRGFGSLKVCYNTLNNLSKNVILWISKQTFKGWYPLGWSSFRGCPHIMSANFGGFQTPPSPLVSNRQQLPNPPPPPSSAFVSIWLTPFYQCIQGKNTFYMTL